MYGHVITKFSRFGRLLHFLTHGAAVARFACESSANKFNMAAVSVKRSIVLKYTHEVISAESETIKKKRLI